MTLHFETLGMIYQNSEGNVMSKRPTKVNMHCNCILIINFSTMYLLLCQSDNI